MAKKLTAIKIVPHFMRLHEWVALENGYYEAEGLQPQLLDEVMHQVSSHDGKEYYERPQDRPFVEGVKVANSACHWGSTCNAGAGMGKFIPDLYGVANYSIFVRDDAPYRSLLDLAGVPIGVGIRAGSHFTTLKAMEMIHPRAKVVVRNLGGPGRRLQALESREIEAANLMDPEISMAEQCGLRSLAMGQFRTLFWVSEDFSQQVLNAYFRVLKQADGELRAHPESYLHLWKRNIPPAMRRDYDYKRFSLGELLLFEPYDRGFYEETHAWLEVWGLRNEIKESNYENLVARVSF